MKMTAKKQLKKEEEKLKPRLSRTRTIGNLYNKKYKLLPIDGIWKEVLGDIEASGCWLIFGKDKNGKSRLALLLAKYLSFSNRILYISAEEGESLNFKNMCQWAGFMPCDRKFHIKEYIDINELKERLTVRNAPNIVFIDNITFYHDELKYGGIRSLLNDFRKTIFVFIAHEQMGEPYTSTAKMVSKLATVIMHVQGLRCHISGRVLGGIIDIDSEKAQIYHGEKQSGIKKLKDMEL
jgi:hypothetical protein